MRYRILIKNKEGKILEEFYTLYKKNKKDPPVLCDNCCLYKYCCDRTEFNILISLDDGVFYQNFDESICSELGDNTNFTRSKKSITERSFYIEKKHKYHDYGDELLPNPVGAVYMSPHELIEKFCKKTCPGHIEGLSCIKDLSCPFHEFFKGIFDYVRK